MDNFEKKDDYFYENTKVLKNKLNILDKDLLKESEKKLTALRISELSTSPIVGDFDFEHLKKINYYIFQDIYEWAGQVRKSELAKLDLFCLYNNIDDFANSIFTGLQADKYFIEYDYDMKIAKLVELFGNINALHPFREGNGRTQREFIEELAKVDGINLDLTKIGQNTMIQASHRSMNGDNSQLEELFAELSSPMSLQMQLYYISTLCNPKLAKKLLNCVMSNNKKR